MMAWTPLIWRPMFPMDGEVPSARGGRLEETHATALRINALAA